MEPIPEFAGRFASHEVDMVLKEIERNYQSMSAAEKRVADVILSPPKDVMRMSMAWLSKTSDTSDATVMRMCKRIGQTGFYQLKINLAIESKVETSVLESDPAPERPQDVADYVSLMCSTLPAIARNVSMGQVSAAIDLLLAAEEVYLFGWGNTNTIAQDLAHRLFRIGIKTFSSENVEYIMRAIILARKGDVFVAVSHAGHALYTVECMKLAQKSGCKVILITNEPESPSREHADITLCCGVNDDLLGDRGYSSHVPELLICDLLLYFLADRTPRNEAGMRSEGVLARFSL